MIKELDPVVLLKDIPTAGLRAGDVGTIVMVHDNGRGYEVEFATFRGLTLAVMSLSADDVRAVGTHEIAHVRDVA